MILKKKELYFFIVMMYCFTFLFGNDYLFSFINNFTNLKNYLVVICPIIFIIYFFIKIIKEKKIKEFISHNKTLLIISLLLIIISILSAVFGIIISLTNIKGLLNLVIIIALINIICFIKFSENDSKIIKNNILTIFCITSIYSICQYIFNLGLSTGGTSKYFIMGRATSTFYIATLYDKYIMLNIIYILYLTLKEKNIKYYFMLCLGVIALALTFSRTSFVILCIVCALYFIICLLKKKFKNILVLPLLVLILISINGYPLVIQSTFNYVYKALNFPAELRFDFSKILYNDDSIFGKFYIFQRKTLGINIIDENLFPNTNIENEVNNPEQNETPEPIDPEKPIQNTNPKPPISNNDIIGTQIEDIDTDKSLGSREYYENVGKVVVSENKLLGIGIGNYYYLYKNQNVNDYLENKIDTSSYYLYPHNNYIHIAAEIGIPGMILFVIIMLLPIILKRKFSKEYIFLSLSMIILFIVAGFSESIMHAKHFIYVYTIISMSIICISEKNYKEDNDNKKSMIIYLPKLIYGGMEKSLINFINYSNYNNTHNLYLRIGYIVDKEMLKLLPKNIDLKIYCKGKWNLISKITSYVKMKLEIMHNYILNKPYDYSVSYAYQHGILASLSLSASKNNSIFIHSDLGLSRDKKQIKSMSRNCKYSKFKKIICVSDSSRESFIKNVKVDSNKVYVINNFINGKEIIKKSKEKINKKYDFIVVARLEENSKRISRILEASKILKDKGYKFTVGILGMGTNYNDYKNFIKENKLENYVYLEGLKENPYPYIKNAKSLLISSQYEGYSVTYLEARILGTYIITTDVSDFKKDLDKADGVIVDKDSISISSAMEKIINCKKINATKLDYDKFNENQKERYNDIYLNYHYNSNLLFISSVGGHLTQLLELKGLFKKYNYTLITEYTDVTKSMKDKYNIKYLPYGSRNQKLLYPFILLWSCIKSLYYIIKLNPDVIITTGANTAAAMCCLGKLFGKKVIYIESFAKSTSPTITGKCIYKLHAYTTFVVQWEGMLKFYPNAECWGWIY